MITTAPTTATATTATTTTHNASYYRSVGFTIEEVAAKLNDTGLSSSEQADELISKGFSLVEVQQAGYSKNDILKSGAVTEEEYATAAASAAAAASASEGTSGGTNTAVIVVILLIVVVIVGAVVHVFTF